MNGMYENKIIAVEGLPILDKENKFSEDELINLVKNQETLSTNQDERINVMYKVLRQPVQVERRRGRNKKPTYIPVVEQADAGGDKCVVVKTRGLELTDFDLIVFDSLLSIYNDYRHNIDGSVFIIGNKEFSNFYDQSNQTVFFKKLQDSLDSIASQIVAIYKFKKGVDVSDEVIDGFKEGKKPKKADITQWETANLLQVEYGECDGKLAIKFNIPFAPFITESGKFSHHIKKNILKKSVYNPRLYWVAKYLGYHFDFRNNKSVKIGSLIKYLGEEEDFANSDDKYEYLRALQRDINWVIKNAFTDDVVCELDTGDGKNLGSKNYKSAKIIPLKCGGKAYTRKEK